MKNNYIQGTYFKLSIVLLIFFMSIGCKDDTTQLDIISFPEGIYCNYDFLPDYDIQEIQIGEQIWMANNLAVYTEEGSWYYDNSCDNSIPNGRLYDWATMMNGESSSNLIPSGVQGLCPDGWHLPSAGEWSILERHLAANGLTGDDLKLNDPTLWPLPHTGTNTTGFGAVPTGSVYNLGNSFGNIHFGVNYLTTSMNNDPYAPLSFALKINTSSLVSNIPTGPYDGWSVRCVKDQLAH